MIKNDKQYSITKNKRDEFSKSLSILQNEESKDNLLNQIMKDSITSQIETFDREIKEYENLKNTKPTIIFSSIEKLPEILIKARIIKGLSQNDLAKKINLKEQQIQRYEASNYESANFDRMLTIAQSMGIQFESTKIKLDQNILHVDGYDPNFIKQATRKLQSKRTLFSV